MYLPETDIHVECELRICMLGRLQPSQLLCLESSSLGTEGYDPVWSVFQMGLNNSFIKCL